MVGGAVVSAGKGSHKKRIGELTTVEVAIGKTFFSKSKSENVSVRM